MSPDGGTGGHAGASEGKEWRQMRLFEPDGDERELRTEDANHPDVLALADERRRRREEGHAVDPVGMLDPGLQRHSPAHGVPDQVSPFDPRPSMLTTAKTFFARGCCWTNAVAPRRPASSPSVTRSKNFGF